MNFPISRRDMLRRVGTGFGTLGLASVLHGAATATPQAANPLAPKPPHFPAKAKRVIFLFMNGGPSHVDTFDPKPALEKYHGAAALGPNGINTMRQGNRNLMRSPFAFKRCGRAASRSASCSPRSAAASTTSASSARCTPTFPTTSRAADDELRRDAADPAEHGLVADLRPGHREPEPARLRRPLPRQAGRRPAALEQQLPARHLPGHAHQQRVDRPEDADPQRRQPLPDAGRASAASSTCSSR